MGGVRWGGGAAQRKGQGQSLTSLGGGRACAGDARMQTASTHRCSLRRVSRPSSHGRRTGCRWAQCLEKGRKAREMMSENNQGKQTNLGIQFVFCFCSAQNINYSSHAKHTAKLLRNIIADGSKHGQKINVLCSMHANRRYGSPIQNLCLFRARKSRHQFSISYRKLI